MSRHKLCVDVPEDLSARHAKIAEDARIKIGYIGRVSEEKGIDLLLRAIRKDQSLRVTLDVHGVMLGSGAAKYKKMLMRIVKKDPRIQFREPVESRNMISLLRSFDILAVPSQCLETGPLVIVEAFGAGIPVLGSRLGGIAWLVKDRVDGLLVSPNTVSAWHAAIKLLDQDRSLLERLRSGVQSPGTMEIVAEEMLALYRQLILRHALPTYLTLAIMRI